MRFFALLDAIGQGFPWGVCGNELAGGGAEFARVFTIITTDLIFTAASLKKVAAGGG